MNDLKVTSLEELKVYAKGQVVELPPFAEDQPFVARLVRPSMIDMIGTGAFPNELLEKATELFMEGAGSIKSEEVGSLKGIKNVMEYIFEASFVEPTYSQIKELGLKLTDDQKMFVFNYCQMGVKALESFRDKQ